MLSNSAEPNSDPLAIRRALEAGTIRRVLAVRVARVGDTLHVRPALNLLRAALPDAFLVFLCSDYARSMAHGLPVDRVVPYPHKGRTLGPFLARRRAVRMLEELGPFDLWIGLEDKPWGRRLARRLGCRFWHSESDTGTHVVERKAGVLAPLGLWNPETGGLPPEITWEPATTSQGTESLAGLERPLFGLQAGSHASRLFRPPRRRRDPSAEWLLDTGAALHAALGGSVVVHAGQGGTEGRVAREVQRELTRMKVPTHLLEGLSLDSLGVALTQLDVFVGANTGPAHMAAAVGTPVVLLSGPTASGIAPPWRAGERLRVIDLRLDCSPCKGTEHGRACRVPRCLDTIPAQRIVEAVRGLL